MSKSLRYIAIRSVTDRVVAAILLVLASPVLAAVAVAVAVFLGKPVFFKQERIGQGGRPFSILKFRTMVKDAEKIGGGYMPPELNLIPPLGRFLRASSLDELPQLWNIVTGDMAFVGPRPALPDQFARYTPRQTGRVSVPQGVTGLAQVRYRNNAPWSVRIEADLEYVERIGFRTDVSIFMATLKRVLTRSDVRLDQSRDEVDDLGAPGSRKDVTDD